MANIFVVDDNPAIQKLVSHHLRKEGHYVMLANSAEEALEKDLDIIPDLLIIDKMMPGMTGFDLVERLKSEPATAYIRLILLTSHDKPSDIVEGLNAGADDYIVKPFDPQILLARVKAQLRTKVIIDQLRRGNIH